MTDETQTIKTTIRGSTALNKPASIFSCHLADIHTTLSFFSLPPLPLHLHFDIMRPTIFHMSAAIICAVMTADAAAIISREHCSVPSANWECPRGGFTEAGPYPKTET